MDLEKVSSGVSMSSLLAEGELVVVVSTSVLSEGQQPVVLVWPSALVSTSLPPLSEGVVSTSRAGGGVGIRGRHQFR